MRLALAAAVAGANLIDRAAIVIVLQREVLRPYGGIIDRIVQRDDLVKRRSRFLLALEDVREQRGDPHDRDGRTDSDKHEPSSAKTASRWLTRANVMCVMWVGHSVIPSTEVRTV